MSIFTPSPYLTSAGDKAAAGRTNPEPYVMPAGAAEANGARGYAAQSMRVDGAVTSDIAKGTTVIVSVPVVLPGSAPGEVVSQDQLHVATADGSLQPVGSTDEKGDSDSPTQQSEGKSEATDKNQSDAGGGDATSYEANGPTKDGKESGDQPAIITQTESKDGSTVETSYALQPDGSYAPVAPVSDQPQADSVTT